MYVNRHTYHNMCTTTYAYVTAVSVIARPCIARARKNAHLRAMCMDYCARLLTRFAPRPLLYPGKPVQEGWSRK